MPSSSNMWIDTSVVPENFLTLKSYAFFHLIKTLASDTIARLLQIQDIDSVQIFMRCTDVLEFFQLNTSQIDQIRNEACFHLNSPENRYIVKIGVQISIRHLRELFSRKLHEQKSMTYSDSESDRTSIKRGRR